MGFDCVPVEVALDCPVEFHDDAGASRGSDSGVMIRDMGDFERYAWPNEERPIEFSHFERVRAHLPEGAKVVGTITAQARGPKLTIFKMKRRKGYRRKMGHRQSYTEIRVDRIEA